MAILLCHFFFHQSKELLIFPCQLITKTYHLIKPSWLYCFSEICMINLVEHILNCCIFHFIYNTKMVVSQILWSSFFYWNMIAAGIVSTLTSTGYWPNHTPTKDFLNCIRTTLSIGYHLFWFQSFCTVGTNQRSHRDISIWVNFICNSFQIIPPFHLSLVHQLVAPTMCMLLIVLFTLACPLILLPSNS